MLKQIDMATDKCIVKLQYGSYKGEQTVYCDADDEDEMVIAKAWKKADANFLSMAYKSAKIISRELYCGD